MSKISAQIIQITLATGPFAGRTRSALNFAEASKITNDFRDPINGAPYDKIDYTIAFEDGYVFEGSAKIDNRSHADFSEVSTRYIRDFLDEAPLKIELISRLDPEGNRRADLQAIAQKYDFGSWLSHVEPDQSAFRI
jgi:hypothetical protein